MRPEDRLHLGFRGILQGDALGVEFARGSRPPPLGGEDGLIDGLPSRAEAAFATAKETYAKAGILGSDDKDVALCWGGLLGPGELTAALRADLVLPDDIDHSLPFAWFSIREPKTRYTAARHQSVKVDHPDILRTITIAFAPLRRGDKLWPSSGQTLQTRLRQLLEALRVPSSPGGSLRHLELASLRAGGASWMMLVSEDPALVQRRGRWLSSRVFEIYIQEVGTLQFLPALPEEARYRIRQALAEYHNVLNTASFLQDSGIASKNWFSLFAARMHA